MFFGNQSTSPPLPIAQECEAWTLRYIYNSCVTNVRFCSAQIAATLAAAALFSLLLTTRPAPLPRGVPSVRGFPLLGSLPAFARSSTSFLSAASAKHGAAWACRLLRTPCLFLTDPADFHAVWRRSDSLSWDAVGLEVNQNVMGISDTACRVSIDAQTHALWTQHLAGSKLPAVAAALARHLFEQADHRIPGTVAARAIGVADAQGWRRVQLVDFVDRLVAHAEVKVGGAMEFALCQTLRLLRQSWPTVR